VEKLLPPPTMFVVPARTRVKNRFSDDDEDQDLS
jgi:hypothetical protein